MKKNTLKKPCINHADRKRWSEELCLPCFRAKYAKPLKKTPLAPVSEKQKAILSAYRLVRLRKLNLNPTCEIHLDGCTMLAVEIHHTAKKQTESDWLDIKKYKSTCSHCHRLIEESPDIARQLGIYNYSVI